ncbi:hypothetical protein FRC11_003807, partial [Ceratobasidium sp. 423]
MPSNVQKRPRARPPVDDAVSKRAPDGPLDSENNPHESMRIWFNMNRELAETQDQVTSAGVSDDIRKQIAKGLIGAAHFRCFGPRDIYETIDPSDPKARCNPRPTSESHILSIYQQVRTITGKRDHLAPIYILVSRKQLTQELQDEMHKALADVSNPTATTPRLELIRPNAKEEDELMEAIWLGMKQQGEKMLFYTADEIQVMRTRLTALQKGRVRVILLNGNHRIHAMLRWRDEINRERMTALKAIEAVGYKAGSHHMDQLQECFEKARYSSWRVLVYDADVMTQSAINELVKNEDQLPQKGMGAGERVWWIAEWYEGMVRAAIDKGLQAVPPYNVSRSEAMTQAHREFIKQVPVDEFPDSAEVIVDDIKGGGKGKKKATTRKVAADVDLDRPVDSRSIHGLAEHPLALEFMIDCRPALRVFGEVLLKKNLDNLNSDYQTSAITQLWLAIRTLHMIANVTLPQNTEEILKYLLDSPIQRGGYETAIAHWDVMHSDPQRTPTLLSEYAPSDGQKFDALFDELLEPLRRPLLGFNYGSSEFEMCVRNIFDKMGNYWLSMGPDHRILGISARLYARLPIRASDDQVNRFHPEAFLPANKWLEQVIVKWVPGMEKGKAKVEEMKKLHFGLQLLEILIDRWSLLWTTGALPQNRQKHWGRWYERERGLNQVTLCRLFKEQGEADASAPRTMEANLSSAIRDLEDPRLHQALLAVYNKAVTSELDLREECRVRRSGTQAGYLVLPTYVEGSDIQESHNVLLSARTAIRKECERILESAQDPTNLPADVQSLKGIRDTYPILNIIPAGFWETTSPALWLAASPDNDNSKRMKSVSVLVGWGLYTMEMWRRVGRLVLSTSEESRWLLKVAKDILREQDRSFWAEGQIVQQDKLPPLPTPPPPPAAATTETQPTPSDGQANTKTTGQEKRRGQGAQSQAGRRGQGRKSRVKSAATVENKDDSPKENGGSPVTTAHATTGAPETTTAQTKSASNARTDHQSPPPEETAKERVLPLTQIEVALQKRVKEERAKTSAATNAPEPEREGEHDFAAVLRNANPGHYYMKPVFGGHAPAHIYGRLARRDVEKGENIPEDQDQAINEAKRTVEKMQNLLEDLEWSREDLRASAYELARACVRMPLGSDFAMTWLAGSIAHLKDLFVIQCAKKIEVVFWCSWEEALNEAMLMAHTDGLFDAELVRIQIDTGDVYLDLTCTFAKGTQTEEEEYELHVGRLGKLGEDRNDTLRRIGHLLPVRGLGQTETEAHNRGAIGLCAMVQRQGTLQLAPEMDVSMKLTESDVSSKRWDPLQDSIRHASEVVASRYQMSRGRVVRAQSKLSALSTGKFYVPDDPIPQHADDPRDLPNGLGWDEVHAQLVALGETASKGWARSTKNCHRQLEELMEQAERDQGQGGSQGGFGMGGSQRDEPPEELLTSQSLGGSRCNSPEMNEQATRKLLKRSNDKKSHDEDGEEEEGPRQKRARSEDEDEDEIEQFQGPP